MKESSTTTKLRMVFDASAKTTSGLSLNDLLLPGPSLYPSLPSVLNKFRCHQFGMSADISKMFREVALNEEEKNYHRFLMESKEGEIEDWRMCRLTFGVTSSPFLATQVLRQVAKDHQLECPIASDLIHTVFYVDDVLTEADSVDQAKIVRKKLNELLNCAQMKLRKWRSNSQALLDSIPEDLRVEEGLQIPSEQSRGAKTLGVYWDTVFDTLHVSVPSIELNKPPTKREVASAAARVFDVLGWFAPAVVWVKILLQQIWELRLDWDEQIPEHLQGPWEKWKQELSVITDKGLPRKLYSHGGEVTDV